MPERRAPFPTATPATVSSPCVRNCCVDEADICLGCFRSLEEICAWSSATDARRRQILEHARQRRQRAHR